MDEFKYVDGALHCEKVPVRALADEYGTPLYVYSAGTIRDHYARIRSAFSEVDATICYSVKSCHNLSILTLLRDLGSDFDIVSGGELRRVLEIGVAPERIVFAGVGKTNDEIVEALKVGIGWFNVESEEELENIARLALDAGKVARVALRINPDVDPKTHRYTTTGLRETKFGVDIERAKQVFKCFRGRDEIDLAGIHVHIGSPVNTIEPYVQSMTRACALIDELNNAGYGIRAINLGGGFGAHYDGAEAPFASEYAKQIQPLLANRGLAVYLEPGRSITANAGILVAKVLYRKASGEKQFLICDAAMTDLLRPSLYGSFHFVWPVDPGACAVPSARSADIQLDGSVLVDVVGPVCESGDFLAKDRWLPSIEQGEYLAVFSAGAYGFVMSSQYNSRQRAAEVLVDGRNAKVIRQRESYDDMVALERL